MFSLLYVKAWYNSTKSVTEKLKISVYRSPFIYCFENLKLYILNVRNIRA